MQAKTKNIVIHFRVTDEDDLLSDEAKKRKLSMGQTARIVVLEALSGFDQKQEFFLRRLDCLDKSLELLLNVSSLGAAAGSLPLDAEKQDVGVLREKLKIHFQHSSDLGKNLVDLIKKGKL